MSEIKLSQKQEEMMAYIKEYIKTNGMAPNATEAALHFDKSRQACVDIMDRLKEIGAIDFNKHGVRMMTIGGETYPVNLKSPVTDVESGERSGSKITRAYETEAQDVKIKSKFLMMAWR